MAPPATDLPLLLPPRGPAVTGVGSLPVVDAAEALRFIAAQAPEVPFWPQLPARGPQEGMLRQALGVPADLLIEQGAGLLRVAPGARAALLDALVDGDAALTPDQAHGFAPFRRAVRHGMLPRAWAVKGQLAGPTVVAGCVRTDTGTAAHDADLSAAIVDRLVARARWQATALLELGLPAVVVVDDPSAGDTAPASGGPAPLARVVAAIADSGAVAGVHSCATSAELPAVPALGLTSLDVLQGDLPTVARDLWARGGWLAAGLVPSVAGRGGLPSAGVLAARWRRLAGSTGDPADLAGRTLITATCGLAGVDPAGAAASFDRADEVAALIARPEG